MQVDAQGLRTLRRHVAQVQGVPDARDRAQARAHQLDAVLGPDLRRLVRAAWDASQDEIGVRDVDYRTILAAVGRTLVALPAHRTYVDPVTGAADAADVAVVDAAIAEAREVPSRRRIPDAVWRWLTDLLTGQVRWSTAAAEAVTRFQQLAASVAVLGTHGRLFLRHQALVAACEVGCDPDDVVVDPGAVHAAIVALPPAGMRTTATLDAVHGEDVRLRLAALSGMAAEWAAATDRIMTGGQPPDGALRLLQLVVGTWPISDDGSAPLTEVLGRPDGLVACAIELARGQDLITSHLDPDVAAEADLAAWVRGVCDPAGEIAHTLRPLARRAAEVGMASSLAQVLLRVTVPGIPDTFQGTEQWDEALQAPDDPPAVDFDEPAAVLDGWVAAPPDPARLWVSRRDGLVKQWVLWQALQARRAAPAVFGPDGGYEAVAVTGRWASQLLVFRRFDEDGGQAVVVCPRLLGRVTDGGRFDPVGRIWADTEVVLPPLAAGSVWQDVLSARAVVAASAVAASELLSGLPVALLVARPA